MVLNLRPLDMGLLDCVVEECDERFVEREQEEILGVVRRVLGGGGVDVGKGDAEVDEGGNGEVVVVVVAEGEGVR